MAEDKLTEEHKKAAREELERELADRYIPEDLKQTIRDNAEIVMLQRDTELGPAANDRFGAERWDDAVNRYRGLGARQRGPVQIDQRQADQARGVQMGSLGLLEGAAKGNAPSQAAIQGRAAGEAAVAGATQGIAGARGVGGQIAAARQAGGAMSNQLVGSLAQSTLGRANEATQDRGAFATAAAGARGQDIGAATTNAELVAKSRAQDEARQQSFEKMGWNTRSAELGANVEIQRQEDAKQQEIRDRMAARAGREKEQAGFVARTAAGGLSSMFSDERTKRRALAVGSLSGIGGR